MAERRLIGPGGSQRVVYIYYLQHPGQQRDIGSTQTIRIAAAVGMFMVMANDGQHEAQGLQRFANVLARDGMLLHDLPFWQRQIAALFENFVGHRDFSEVMKKSTSPQGYKRFLLQAQMSPQVRGMLSQALAVALSVRIAGLHATAQRAEHRLGRFQLVGELFQLE